MQAFFKNATPSTNARWVLVATILASSMAFIDGTVVNIALPALQKSLYATASNLQWVVESYALLLASLLLLGGSLGDLYGRRRIFVAGVILFTLGSAACGFAPSIATLIIARGVQGAGAAFLVPGSLALISASFPAKERGRAIGTWSGFTAITAAIGPILGGWLVQHGSWRWVFFINLPLAVVVLAITFLRVQESYNEKAIRDLDWQGAALATVGLGAVTFALIESSRGGAIVWSATVIGTASLIAFFFVEARSPAPMISLALFRSKDFTGSNLLTFFLYAALSGLLYFFPLDLIQVQHYSATQAGAALLPLILLIFLLSRWSGGLIARYGARLPLTIGPLIAAAGFALLLRSALNDSYWKILFPAVVILGIGMAITVAPLTTAVMESVPATEAGVASGVNNAVSRIAGLLAIAVYGIVLSAVFNRTLDRKLAPLDLSSSTQHTIDSERDRLAGAEASDSRIQQAIEEAFISGYHATTWISVTLALLSALSAQMISSTSQNPGTNLKNTSSR